MNSPTPWLILVIPCYKESLRLPHLLPDLMEALKDLPCLVQVVDDGSPAAEMEATRALVEGLRSRYEEKLAPVLCLQKNGGKGAAVRAGWLAHPNAVQWAFVDADGSISPREVRRVALMAMANPDIAYFASRVKMLGRKIHRTPLRHYYGRIFATLSSVLLSIDVYDSQCGFKILPTAALKQKLDLLKENGFAFDLEILMVLSTLGVPIEEIPIDWAHVSGSKVRLTRDAVAMVTSLIRIRRRHQVKKNAYTAEELPRAA